MSDQYSKIRFIGYPIPTTPAKMVSIGNPNGPGSVAGTYLADADPKTDLANRVAILKNAVEVAKAQLPAGEDPTSVTNVFVAPEFYYHGQHGPYLYSDDADDPAEYLLSQLQAAFPASEYPNWTFVCGSMISAKVADVDGLFAENSAQTRNAVVKALSEQWQASFGALNGVIFDMLINFIKVCHSYPNVTVRNRAMLLSNVGLWTPAGSSSSPVMTTEKYYVSNEDFVLYDTDGRPDVVTEQMTAYPPIDLSGGDLKQTDMDQFAIFRQHYGSANFPDYMDFGVEICLDHSDVRLRRNLGREPWPRAGDAIHVQLIPSCGMQISPPSVAADRNGFVFNCDGQYALDQTTGTVQTTPQNGVTGLYANYIDPSNSAYAAHTQLARVETPATGNDPNASGSTNASFQALDASDVSIVPVPTPTGLDAHFAAGAGAVHIYGLGTPYTLYPQGNT